MSRLLFMIIAKLSLMNSQFLGNSSDNTTVTEVISSENGLVANSGDSAFVAVAAILVFIMTPALGLFYGGLLKRKNLLNIMAQCFMSNAIVAIVWTLLGFSIAFGKSHNGFIGDSKYFVLSGVNYQPHPVYGPTLPFLLFFYFQSQFACITPSLIVGSIAERVRYWPIMIYIAFWSLLVYSPLAHWNWNMDGWLFLLGSKDWAGGNVIHISGGVASMACVMALERVKPKIDAYLNIKKKKVRKVLKEELTETFKDKQMNSVFVILGTMILWFGWFGFNAGSSLSAGNSMSLSLVTTNITPAVTMLSWAILDIFHKGDRISVNGMCIACVCALIGITPAAGIVRVWHTIIIGILSAVIPYYFMYFRSKFEIFDDRLDVFAAHGLAGIVGGLSLGFHYCDIGMDNECKPESGIGIVWGYGGLQVVYQMIGISATVVYAFVISYVLFIIVMFVFSYLNMFDADETIGLDRLEIFEQQDILELSHLDDNSKLIN